MRGIALIGALSVLEEHGYQPHHVAGTSAGAIVTTLLAAGYTSAEMADIIIRLDFNRFRQLDWEDHVPLIGKGLSVFIDQGIYDGEFVVGWMRELLAARGVRTFRDLVGAPASADPRYRYKAQVVASDITARRLLVLPRDAEVLGVAPDDLEVALAVRMSMGIPIFFKPVRWHNPTTGQEHLIVDGGMLSNFPIWLFDAVGEPLWPTFGLRLVDREGRPATAERLPAREHRHGGTREVAHYLRSLVETMLEAHDRLYIERASFARTIAIPTLGIPSTDFGLTTEQKWALHASGRAAAAAFLESWSFEGYRAAFRRERRPEVSAQTRPALAASQLSA